MDSPNWMTHAFDEVGETEVKGSRDNPRIVAMYRDAGHPGVKRDEVAWCAAFVGACLERTGIRSTRSLMARSYLDWGEELKEPRHGAIVVLKRGRNPALGHVGFLVRETATRLYLLGGNQSDQVKVSPYPKTRLLGYRWPSAADVREGAPLLPVTKGMTPVQMAEVFERALQHVLEMEGGYTDDPHDPGGATNFGITIGEFAHAKGVNLTAQTMPGLKQKLRRISPLLVRRIYRQRYWQRAKCRRFEPALAVMHFDCAVNQGVGRAVKFLQEAVGADVDGEIGPLTIAAAAEAPIERTLQRYWELRRKHYRGLSHFWRFGRGWLRRLDKTLELSKELVEGSAVAARTAAGEQANEETRTMTAKAKGGLNSGTGAKNERTPAASKTGATLAERQTVNVAPKKWWGESITIWGALLTAASTVLPVLGPLVGLDLTADLVKQLGDQLVTFISAAGGVIGTLMTIFGRARATTGLQRREVRVMM